MWQQARERVGLGARQLGEQRAEAFAQEYFCGVVGVRRRAKGERLAAVIGYDVAFDQLGMQRLGRRWSWSCQPESAGVGDGTLGGGRPQNADLSVIRARP